MTELMGAIINECRLAFRSSTFKISLILVIFLTLLRGITDTLYTSWGIISSAAADYQGILGLFAVLFAVTTVYREKTDKIEDIFHTLPYSTVKVYIGKILGGFIPLLILTILFIVQLILIQMYKGWAPVQLDIYLYHFLLILPSLLFLYAIGMVAGVLINDLRLAYAGGLAGWFVSYIIIATNYESTNNPFMRLLRLLPARRSIYYSEITGYFADMNILSLHRFFYLSICIIILLIALKIYNNNRARLNMAYPFLLSIFVIIASLTGAFYASELLNRNEQYALELESLPYEETGMAQALSQYTGPNAPDINSYKLNIEFDLTEQSMKVSGAMNLVNNSENIYNSFPLTLRDNFSISSLRDISGESVSFSRSDSTLWIDLSTPLHPEQEMVLEIAYEGQVNIWRARHSQSYLKPAYFISEAAVYLPDSFGWYPLPGKGDTAHIVQWPAAGEQIKAIDDQFLYTSEANFELYIRGLKSLNMVSFASCVKEPIKIDDEVALHIKTDLIPGFSIIAADYYKTQDRNITIYHSKSTRKGAELLANQLESLSSFYRNVLEMGHDFHLTVVQSPTGVTDFNIIRPLQALLINDSMLGSISSFDMENKHYALPNIQMIAINSWFEKRAPDGSPIRSIYDMVVSDFIRTLYIDQMLNNDAFADELSYRLEIQQMHKSSPGGRMHVHSMDMTRIAGRSFDESSNELWLLLAELYTNYEDSIAFDLAQQLVQVDPLRGIYTHELEQIKERIMREAEEK